MPRDVTIVFVHGIHVTQFDYATAFLDRLSRQLPRPLRRHVNHKTVFWAEIVRDRSTGYMNKALSTTVLQDSALRRLVVEGLGDAAAYQKTLNRDNSAYFGIQGKLTAKLKEAEVATDPTRPLVLIGHSLGCHILSSYCWDINRLKQIDDVELNGWNDAGATEFVRELREAPPFRKLDTLAGIVTMGCNIPLFTFTFGPDRVFPITHPPGPKMTPAFPGKGLTSAQKTKARWINFYGPNDLLGYPLKPLNSHYYEDERIQDRIVRSEGFWRSWLVPSIFNTYKAHLGYWTNATVIRETAALVRQVIEADDIPFPKRTSLAEPVNHHAPPQKDLEKVIP